jgi:hypothetical protein
LINQDRPLTLDQDSSKGIDSNESKKPWQPMRLTYTGEAKDVVQFPGNGKISTSPSDPGDPKKPPGQG